MARNPVTPVRPVNPVEAVRRVDSGATYFRHLSLWRSNSESYAAKRRAQASSKPDNTFARRLSAREEPDS